MKKDRIKLIVIGGTAAGPSAIAKARRVNEFADIKLFEKTKSISYGTCGMPYFLSGVIPNKYQLVVQKPNVFAKRFAVDLHLSSEVIKINSKNKEISVKNLENDEIVVYGYDKLIYCCGARPIIPPILGVNLNNIFVLRTLNDLEKFHQALTFENPAHKRAVIVGGGLIGLEVAENLRLLGLEVSIVELLDQVLPLFDKEISFIIENELKKHGISVFTSNGVKEFLGDDCVQKVVLQDDTELPVDFILLAVGIRPNTELAKEVGIEIGESRAIKVNEYMETNIPDIYAAGDCTETINLITNKPQWIPLATIANKQGRTAGANSMGKKLKFKGAVGSAIAKIFDLDVGITGLNEKNVIKEKINYLVGYLHPDTHVKYYPGAEILDIKIIIDKETERIIGTQVIGKNGVDKRIDVFATAILGNITIDDFINIDTCYAPPFSNAKDPVIIAGMVAHNIISKEVETITVNNLNNLLVRKEKLQILDVRRDDEWVEGHFPNAIHINIQNLRDNLDIIDKNIPVYVYCKTGIRSYLAYRILKQRGFNVKNVNGGYLSWLYSGFDIEK
ncbi:MAG: FAD-dependent oxidoreductase [Candidatus Helarchaeota archaeon]